jgi:hypothetical protein
VSIQEASQLSAARYEVYLSDVTRLSRFVSCDVAVDSMAAGTNLSVEISGLHTDMNTFEKIQSKIVTVENGSDAVCRLAVDRAPVVLDSTACVVGRVYHANRIEYRAYRFVIELDLNTSTHGNTDNVRFILATHDDAFTVAEFVLTVVACVCTTVFLSYWVILLGTSYARLLPEQRWMIPLLLSLLGNQRPFMIADVYLESAYLSVVSTVFSVSCTTGVMVFLLCVVDALRYRTRELPYSFYIAKSVFGVIFLVCASVTTVAVRSTDAAMISRSSTFAIGVLVAVFGTAVGVVVWVIWIVFTVYRTASRLAYVSYLSNRWRHLSLRFVLFLSTLTLLYVLMNAVVDVLVFTNVITITDWKRSLTTTFVSISNLVLLSAYMYSLAYIFLPPLAACECPNEQTVLSAGQIAALVTPAFGVRRRTTRRWSGRTRSGLFCVEEAAICLELSFDVYYDASPHKRSASGFGVIDVERLKGIGLVMDEFVVDPGKCLLRFACAYLVLLCVVFDTHALIVHRGRAIYVALRGTSSLENAKTDFRMNTVTLPVPVAVFACVRARTTHFVPVSTRTNGHRLYFHRKCIVVSFKRFRAFGRNCAMRSRGRFAQ